jgi:hypothetical protein
MAIRGKEIGTISKKKTTHLKEEEKEQEQEGVVNFERKIGITKYITKSSFINDTGKKNQKNRKNSY